MCRKYSTEVKLVLVNKVQAVYVTPTLKTTTSVQDLVTNRDVVSQKEINNLLRSFYATELRFRNIITAKNLEVYSVPIVFVIRSL